MIETLNAGEAARALGISKWSIYEAVRRREIPHVRFGRRVLFRKESLLAWLDEREAASMASEPMPAPGEIRRLK